MNLTLVRHAYLPDVTLGRWFVANRVYCGLGEPWRADPDGPGGQRREFNLHESCIPDGVYTMRPHTSAKYPGERYVWCLINEALGVYAPGTRPAGQSWGRDAILVHAGTTTANIEGCELVGQRFGIYEGKQAVFDTQVALSEMRTILRRDTHILTIRPTQGTAEIIT